MNESSSSSSSCTTPNRSSPPISSQSSEIALAASSQSQKRKAGRKKFQETRHPVYRGVRRRKGNKWVCEVREPNKKSRIWLGTYPTPEMAARAHDVAALALRGSSAPLNFSDSASLLSPPTSSSAQHIRSAAAKAAEAFRPRAASSDHCCFKSKSMHHIVECDYSNKAVDEGMDPINNIKDNDEFLDEEALYNMPGLLHSMAQGLLLNPPSINTTTWGRDDDFTCCVDLTLWSY